MKLVTFTHNNETRVGMVIDNEIVDCRGNPQIPQTMIELLNAGKPALEQLRQLADSGTSRIVIAEVKLEAPIPKPGKYFGIGLNYAEHIEETGRDKPEFPTFFNKQNTCVIGPGDNIHQPRVSKKLDYEGELAFVIGKR